MSPIIWDMIDTYECYIHINRQLSIYVPQITQGCQFYHVHDTVYRAIDQT